MLLLQMLFRNQDYFCFQYKCSPSNFTHFYRVPTKNFFVFIDKLWPILGFRATLLVAKIYMELFPSSSRRTLLSHVGNKHTMLQQSSDRCRKWLLAAAAQVAALMQMHSPNNSCPQVGNTLTTIPNHLFKIYLKFVFHDKI